MTQHRRPIVSLVIGAVVLALANPASAQDSDIVVTGKGKAPAGAELVTKKVSVGDLDLATPEGEQEMEQRVDAAVKQICWSHPKPARWQIRQSEACSKFAWDGARPQMNSLLERARGN